MLVLADCSRWTILWSADDGFGQRASSNGAAGTVEIAARWLRDDPCARARLFPHRPQPSNFHDQLMPNDPFLGARKGVKV